MVFVVETGAGVQFLFFDEYAADGIEKFQAAFDPLQMQVFNDGTIAKSIARA
jgi:hypothetical protein